MKTFKYQIDGHAFSIRFDEKQGTIADFLVDGEHPEVAEERMRAYAAVIALALIEHDVEVVHDDESGIITLASGVASPWGNPLHMMNNKR